MLLTPTERRLLNYMAKFYGVWVPTSEITLALWGLDHEGAKSRLANTKSRLVAKFPPGYNIESKARRGYRLIKLDQAQTKYTA